MMAIKTFKCEYTEQLFTTGATRQFTNIKNVAERKLKMLHDAVELKDLRSPPANRLEQLQGDRDGQYSIRINDQYHICFNWANNGVENVEIVDYH